MRLPLLFEHRLTEGAELFTHLASLAPNAKGAVIALGNFDGVHLGHQHVIERAVALAKTRNVPAAVMTFEPHPITYFANKAPNTFRLNDSSTKAVLLKEQGVDYVFEVPFNEAFSSLSADAFVREILIDSLAASHIVCGYDFSFGHERSGNVVTLTQLCGEHDVAVDSVKAFYKDEAVVSSTRIRQALQGGEIGAANQLLGHCHVIRGEVLHGDKRGRTIGFPTANIALEQVMAPKKGVYSGWLRMEGQEGDLLPVVMNIGNRPTFEKDDIIVEAHILAGKDYDLYGQMAWLQLVDFIRAEHKFESVETLTERIKQDIDIATQQLGISS